MKQKIYLLFFIITLLLAFNASNQHAATGGPFAYISNVNDGTVSIIDISTNLVVDTVTVGSIPNGVAVSPSGNHAYITNGGGNSLAIIDTTVSPKTVTTVNVGSIPYGAAVNSTDSRVYVTNFGENTLSVIDTSNNTVTATIPVGSGPRGVVVSPNNNFVYTANYNDNTVSVINTSTNTVTATISVGASPYGITTSANGNAVYVSNNGTNTVSVIDTASNTVTTTITTGNQPLGMGVTPNGSTLYIANEGDGTVSVVDTATNTIIGSPITVGAQPDGVTVNPSGTFVYVANFGSSSVSVINTATNTVLASAITVGSAPAGFGSFIGPITSSVQLGAATYSVNEADGSINITVNRSGNLNSSVSVNYATTDVTATAGSDYTTTSGTLNFAANETSKTINVPITNDTAIESDETFTLTLSNISSNASLGAQTSTTVTIVSDDGAQPGQFQFSTTSLTQAESGGNLTVTVTRTNGSDGAVSVDYSVTGGTATVGQDFTGGSGTLTFANGITSQSFTIAVLEDTLVEGDETINLALGNPIGGATLGANSAAVVTITDNDSAGQLQFSTTSLTQAESGGNLTVTVTRTNGSAGSVTADYSVTGGTATVGQDFTGGSGTLTFANGVTSQSFTIAVLEDTLVEGNETINLALGNPGGGATLGANSTAIVTITDNDSTGNLTSSVSNINFGNVTVNTTKSVNITLNNTGTNSLTLTTPFGLTGSNPDQFSVGAPGSVTIAGNSSTTLAVNFQPTATGSASATLTIGSDANSVTIALSGTAQTASKLKVSQTSINFGTMFPGIASNDTVQITNTGSGQATLTAPFTISGADANQFSVSNPGTLTLDGGSSTSFTVTFQPTTEGDKSATLTILNSNNPIKIALSGHCQVLMLSNSDLSFGTVAKGDNHQLNVTITNKSNSTITLTTPFALTGTDADQFSIASLGSTTLAGGASTIMSVSFNPTSNGSKTAQLTVTSQHDAVSMNLNGISAELTVSSSSLDFGNVQAGTSKTTTITLTNNTSSTVTVTRGLSFSGTAANQFSVNAPNTTMAAGESISIEVTFKPTTTGVKNANLNINSTVSNITVSVTGTATAPGHGR